MKKVRNYPDPTYLILFKLLQEAHLIYNLLCQIKTVCCAAGVQSRGLHGWGGGHHGDPRDQHPPQRVHTLVTLALRGETLPDEGHLPGTGRTGS